MEIIRGDLWESNANLILVTGNASVTTAGRLVMGRGAARQMRDRYSGIDIDYAFGAMLRDEGCAYYASQYHPRKVRYRPYLILMTRTIALGPGHKMQWIGLFQVKHGWWEDTDLKLIRRSAGKLARWMYANPRMKVAMNFPGIGYGRLPFDLVREQLNVLNPYDLTVYMYKNKGE